MLVGQEGEIPKEHDETFRVDCGDAFMGVYIWQDIKFHTLSMYSLLHANYISIKH